jgi:hypothetical protein
VAHGRQCLEPRVDMRLVAIDERAVDIEENSLKRSHVPV